MKRSNGFSIYYSAPPDDIFEDLEAEAIKIWNTYDDTYGYRAEKLSRISRIDKKRDDWMEIYTMFDETNKQKLLSAVQPATRLRILAAIL